MSCTRAARKSVFPAAVAGICFLVAAALVVPTQLAAMFGVPAAVALATYTGAFLYLKYLRKMPRVVRQQMPGLAMLSALIGAFSFVAVLQTGAVTAGIASAAITAAIFVGGFAIIWWHDWH